MRRRSRSQRRYLAENPDYEDAQYCLGHIYYAMGDLEKAKDIFEELMHNNYGDMAYLIRLQQVNEAIIDKMEAGCGRASAPSSEKVRSGMVLLSESAGAGSVGGVRYIGTGGR